MTKTYMYTVYTVKKSHPPVLTIHINSLNVVMRIETFFFKVSCVSRYIISTRETNLLQISYIKPIIY